MLILFLLFSGLGFLGSSACWDMFYWQVGSVRVNILAICIAIFSRGKQYVGTTAKKNTGSGKVSRLGNPLLLGIKPQSPEEYTFSQCSTVSS